MDYLTLLIENFNILDSHNLYILEIKLHIELKKIRSLLFSLSKFRRDASIGNYILPQSDEEKC